MLHLRRPLLEHFAASVAVVVAGCGPGQVVGIHVDGIDQVRRYSGRKAVAPALVRDRRLLIAQLPIAVEDTRAYPDHRLIAEAFRRPRQAHPRCKISGVGVAELQARLAVPAAILKTEPESPAVRLLELVEEVVAQAEVGGEVRFDLPLVLDETESLCLHLRGGRLAL